MVLSKRSAIRMLPVMMIAVMAITALNAAPPWKTVKVPFEFTAGGQSLNAGSYRILERSENGETTINLESGAGKAQVPVLTRLARTGQSPAEAKLVFDTTDGKRALSEVWLPGEDGYLVRGNLAEHEHQHEILTGTDSD